MSDTEKNDEALVSPGSTATGSGTSMGETDLDDVGTTEADVTDGRDQNLPKVEGDSSAS
jgi:hypothetical protein